MNQLIESVKKAIEARRNFDRAFDGKGEPLAAAMKRVQDTHTYLDLHAILALLESCGSATPSQVRAALELATAFAADSGDQAIRLLKLTAYRAAVAQEGGEDK